MRDATAQFASGSRGSESFEHCVHDTLRTGEIPDEGQNLDAGRLGGRGVCLKSPRKLESRPDRQGASRGMRGREVVRLTSGD